MTALAPSSAPPASFAPAPRRLRPALHSTAAAIAGLALVAAVGAAGYRVVPLGPPTRGGTDVCVAPAAVAAFAGWPRVVAPVGDDAYEVRGERPPVALALSPEFRAFQACRQQLGR